MKTARSGTFLELEESTGPFGGGKKSGFQQSRPGGGPRGHLERSPAGGSRDPSLAVNLV